MADLYNVLEVYRGDDFNIDLIIQDADGNPVDITNYSFRLTVKADQNDNTDDSTAIIQITESTHTTPTSGLSTITVPRASNTNVGTFYYDVEMTDDNNIKTTPIKGRLKVYQDIGVTD